MALSTCTTGTQAASGSAIALAGGCQRSGDGAGSFAHSSIHAASPCWTTTAMPSRLAIT